MSDHASLPFHQGSIRDELILTQPIQPRLILNLDTITIWAANTMATTTRVRTDRRRP